MNIIDAWKAAKVGQKIRRARTVHAVEITKAECDMSDYRDFHFSRTHRFLDALVRDGHPDHRIFDTHVLADDWEVVKEKHTSYYEFGDLCVKIHRGVVPIPSNAKVEIIWEE